jgi:ribosomal protein L30E
MNVKDLRKALKEQKNVVFGTNETIRGLKRGVTKAVFLASNCNKLTKERIKRYAKINGVKVFELDEPNDEISLVCKVQHIVSVVSY